MTWFATDDLLKNDIPYKADYRAYRLEVHERLNAILAGIPGSSFLEIGVGPVCRAERFRIMAEAGIRYVGLDFESVCQARRSDVREAGIASENIRFIGNENGTYLFNLLRLGRSGERFDIIYLDGSHVINIDLAAAVIGARLIRDNGLFLFDDVRFAFAAKNLFPSTGIYADADGVASMDQNEAIEPHVKIIIQEIMIPLLGFTVDHSISDPDWLALRAPVKD